MINPEAIKSLIELEPDMTGEFVTELETIFAEQSPRLISQISSGIEGNDMKLVFSGAHTLKGSCGYLGMSNMVTLCSFIEEWSKKNDRNVIEGETYLERLQGEFESGRQELHSLIQNMSGHAPR